MIHVLEVFNQTVKGSTIRDFVTKRYCQENRSFPPNVKVTKKHDITSYSKGKTATVGTEHWLTAWDLQIYLRIA